MFVARWSHRASYMWMISLLFGSAKPRISSLNVNVQFIAQFALRQPNVYRALVYPSGMSHSSRLSIETRLTSCTPQHFSYHPTIPFFGEQFMLYSWFQPKWIDNPNSPCYFHAKRSIFFKYYENSPLNSRTTFLISGCLSSEAVKGLGKVVQLWTQASSATTILSTGPIPLDHEF